MRFRTRARALLLVAALAAATVGTATLGAGAAAAATDYRQAIDLTFPVAGPVSYIDDFDHCRSGCTRRHLATDLMVERYGQPVHAAVGGRITWITGLDGAVPSYGFMITIAGDDGREYHYIHLGRQDGPASEAYAPGLADGTTVERGQLIGYAGCSGNASCSAPHLHFQIEDPAVTDPYGSHHVNPYESLRQAQAEGDVPASSATGGSAAPVAPAPVPVSAIPVEGDWDGDGDDDLGWYDEGAVSLRLGDGRIHAYRYGRAGDKPIVGDWDGDGVDTVSIIRDRVWHIRNAHSGGASEFSFTYGRLTAGDLPVPGDFDGDGRDSAAIIRDGEWHLRNDLAGGPGTTVFTYGRVSRGDVPLVGDWNGDGSDEIAVFRAGRFYLRNTLTAGPADVTFSFGTSTDTPLLGDWDGDRVDTAAVVRGSDFLLRNDNAAGGADATVRFAPR